MDIRYESSGARQRIEELALSVSGLDTPPQAADALYDATVYGALGLCGRGDVPRAMEAALGMILADVYKEGLHRPVSSVKRGDTTITYLSGQGTEWARSLLGPFIRLRTAEGGGPWDM